MITWNLIETKPTSGACVMTIAESGAFGILSYDPITKKWYHTTGDVYEGEPLTHWFKLPDAPDASESVITLSDAKKAVLVVLEGHEKAVVLDTILGGVHDMRKTWNWQDRQRVIDAVTELRKTGAVLCDERGCHRLKPLPATSDTPLAEDIFAAVGSDSACYETVGSIAETLKIKPALASEVLEQLAQEGRIQRIQGFGEPGYIKKEPDDAKRPDFITEAGWMPRAELIRDAIVRAIKSDKGISDHVKAVAVEILNLEYGGFSDEEVQRQWEEMREHEALKASRKKHDHLSDIPEPWQSILRKINPNDVFLVVDSPGGLRSMRRYDGDTPVKTISHMLESPCPFGSYRLISGVALRHLVLEMARAVDDLLLP